MKIHTSKAPEDSGRMFKTCAPNNLAPLCRNQEVNDLLRAPGLFFLFVIFWCLSITTGIAQGYNFEAENGHLANGASVQDCESCSGAKQVGNIGGSSNGFFSQEVNASVAGPYVMSLSYSSGDPRSVFVTVNGQGAIEVKGDSGDWGAVGTAELEISLVEGINSIKFSNDGGWAPNIDKFELKLKASQSECENCQIFSFGSLGEIKYNLKTGTANILLDGKQIIGDAYSELSAGDRTFTSKDYTSRTISQSTIIDDFGSGKKIVVNLTSDGLPNMQQIFYTYPERNYFLLEIVLKALDAQSNYMAPLISNSVEIFEDGDNRVLFVPFDNDTFIRYNSKSVQNSETNTSSEITAFYENNSRRGLVVGSVEHAVWKTGVKTSGSGSSLSELRVWGGYTSLDVTRDKIEHGIVSGNEVKSPKIFIGFFEDWRIGLEEFGKANAISEPNYIFDWQEPTPFGWNSWGAIQDKLNLENSKKVVDFFADEIPEFRSGDTAYIDLDSYWDNMINGGLEGDFSQLTAFAEYCKEKGLKPGIYWAPFVDWAKVDKKVEGSAFNYSNVWTKVNGGYHDLDGARALDPTHPAAKQRIDLVIDKFKECGFEMIKIDFLGHAAIEADSFYDPEVKTGMQAFNHGMKYLLDRLDDKMLVYTAISPNLATGPYTHIRRIACDAYADINATEYTLNSTTYGWWQGFMYDYIDADHLVFGNASLGENRARLTSGVVNGTLITGDDYSSQGLWLEKAKELLQNKEIINLAINGEAFRPVEGNSVQGSSETFVHKIGNSYYVAVINYGEEKSYSLSLDRLGITNGDYCVKELFSDRQFSITNSEMQITVGSRDAAIYEFRIGSNGCSFSLPIKNFNIKSTNATCTGSVNGKIEIDVVDHNFNYKITVSGKDSFSLPNLDGKFEHTIEGLSAGVYKVCFKVDGITDYEQCYEVSIEEPQQIIAFTEVNQKRGIMKLNLTGANQFYLSINGQVQKVGSGELRINLRKGLNEVSIKGDQDCQGTYFERIYISEKMRIYPNPAKDKIQVFIPGENQRVTVQIYNLQGQNLLESIKEITDSRIVEINLSSLVPKVYILKVLDREFEETFKFIRQ